MEFLKELLGEELYSQIEAKVNEHNGNEENRDKQIKIANLGSGEYVSKLKLDDVMSQLTGKKAELDSANALINDLKKASKGNEEMQKKFTDYEAENARLQAELQETKLKSAIKVALLSEKAVDVDYLTYKLNESLKEKGETLELDENDNIKGWTDKLSGLKTQFPNMFESGGASDTNGFTPVTNKGLPKDVQNKTITKEQFMNMTVDERIALKQQDETLYRNLKG